MSLSKLWASIKGGANEAIEAVVDTQSIRILDQELREAKEELLKCDQNLTKIMAKRKLAEGRVKSIAEDVETYSGHALAAAEKGDETLAIECAEKVAELEGRLDTEKQLLDGFKQSETALKANIAKAKTNVRRMEQQIDQVKATESVQKAQVAISSRHTGANNKVKTALSSLDRIKTKQQERAAELEAAEEMASEESGNDLDVKLKAAGVISGSGVSGKDKLAQLLAKKKG